MMPSKGLETSVFRKRHKNESVKCHASIASTYLVFTNPQKKVPLLEHFFELQVLC